MQLFRIIAIVLFVLAALGSDGHGLHWGLAKVVGVIACGLAFLALAGIDPPAPPRP